VCLVARESLDVYVYVTVCVCYADFVSEIEAIKRQVTDIDGLSPSVSSYPVVVHCSAGVGRTGVVILVALMKASLERNQVLTVIEFIHYS